MQEHMQPQDSLLVSTPNLPKGGGAIQSIGKGWSAVGATGAATFTLGLPISPGRGFTPALALSYSSAGGKTEFGQGWSISLPVIARRTSKGVPAYADDDEFVTPANEVLLPERDASGNLNTRTAVSWFRGQDLGGTYRVQRYFPRVHGDGARWESWRSEREWFWLVHDSDGTLHVYGKTTRTSDVEGGIERIAEWQLEESVSPHGEHILYEYRHEDGEGLQPADELRDHSRRQYPTRVRYGNTRADQCPFLLQPDPSGASSWHFDLVFDYGARAMGGDEIPGYDEAHAWPVRADPYAGFAYGFEVRTLRLCRQVLMFHTFAPTTSSLQAKDGRRVEIRSLDKEPVLVSRLLLEYDSDAVLSRLVAAHAMGYGKEGDIKRLPPMEFRHIPFAGAKVARFEPFAALTDSKGVQSERPVREPYQLVDLYGEGLPGVLVQDERGWWYREPERDAASSDADAVAYRQPSLLAQIPVAHGQGTSTRQWLADLTGDGKLDWIVARPGMAGFFTMHPDRRWSTFVPFGAFPMEFFHPRGQLADLMNVGLSDFAMIGTRSVRLYANERSNGFARAVEVGHDEDALPAFNDDRRALIAFSDVLGSGQQHLVEIRHDQLSVWPNLGRGRFGRRLVFSALPFDAADFDPSCIRLADLDGSGAMDLIYLSSDRLQVFMNQSGNGLAAPVDVPWPEGVRYERLCELSAADLQGLGCASLVLTIPHMVPRHWRCDFVKAKPYLIDATDNNMGAESAVAYRSSAQEWLDAKAQKLAAGDPAVSYMPFPIHVVSVHRQIDQISGNVLSQCYQYRDGYYDGEEREFRGFGLLIQTDQEASTGQDGGVVSPPQLTKTWYHVGDFLDPGRDGFDDRDDQAIRPGSTLCSNYEASKGDVIVRNWDEATRADAARTLSGMLRRVEVYGIEPGAPDIPFSTMETRYLVRRLRARDAHRRYSEMQSLVAETISYRYERDFGDPQCRQSMGLTWDRHGGATHGLAIYHARRSGATPPFDPSMPDYPHHRRWWDDSQDETQRAYYVTETKAQSIHLDRADSDYWRLHLPYRTRSRACVIERADLAIEDLSYERVLAPESSLADADFVLAGQSLQRYKNGEDGDCKEGEASFEGLADYLETAELDNAALQAYKGVLSHDELEAKLVEAGYHRMPRFDPSDDPVGQGRGHRSSLPAADELWSVRRGFATYAGLNGFFKVVAFRPTQSVGITEYRYDPYWLFPSMVIAPDGCTTIAEYDYRSLQPSRISDPNRTISEARYDALGALMATSIHGTEFGQPMGFEPLSEYQRDIDTPEAALKDPKAAIQEAATAYFLDAFSWMPKLSPSLRQAIEGRTNVMLLDDRLRAWARWRMTTEDAANLPPTLRAEWLSLPRQPMHAASLIADQFTHVAELPRHPRHVDAAKAPRWERPEKQIRISITAFDGFGRVLQSKQKVPPGTAYKTTDGVLDVVDGKPVEVYAETRWRVSEPVEYNNKGLPMRVYRPYFADTPLTIRDQGFRAVAYCDRQHYDALGRPTMTLTARSEPGAFGMRRIAYYPWYTVSEDENDTASEVEAMRSGQASASGSQASAGHTSLRV